MPKETPGNKPKIFETVSQTRRMHIYSAYFMHNYNNKLQIIVNYTNFIHISLVFSYICCNFATTNE